MFRLFVWFSNSAAKQALNTIWKQPNTCIIPSSNNRFLITVPVPEFEMGFPHHVLQFGQEKTFSLCFLKVMVINNC